MRSKRLGPFQWIRVTAVAWLVVACAVCVAADDDAAATVIEVAPNVYMLPGAPGEPDAANLGRVGNAGFIVGPGGVIAVDTGTSYRHGTALLAAIRRTTAQPVRLAIVTHTRQEFLFGAAAFRERGIPVAMQRDAAALMTSRCENCLKALTREIGADAMQGTQMWKPDQSFAAGFTAEATEAIGRPVQVLYFGHSSGPGDVAVFDVRSGVLFAGGLVDAERIPDIGDSDLAGWKEALAALRRIAVRTVVPGHGPAAPPGAVDAVAVYLAQLDARVRALIRADAALSEVPDAASLPDFSTWDQYDTVHRRNASIMFLRAEREQLFK